ncbi:MAG: hypothetical protein A3H69_03565 [Candidatus Sungbacteria bacterium RIFCSPLOWO2_02_FULL_47_9]|uniref:Uncharacterized protein n=1 Tax=Candidatus Sungbacteria bacterium RIFCSPHIGHO2_01_FULL_47_32 TaxID=1802264 RepID=A0A1G2KBV7_9BACT|nr:MAG: hypothetical protein A2633_02495 [Candidatus Sungbacteria bacterium RIFCSPHIGHO2_01_FULL_47_32]OGZ98895.1 MAG: hypothetical protein A3D57_01880 [Candidatus Sungbacteria bacterium RIFCSPHIGHO2_02_FULL_46_12]OHA06190.1 MAG: hypothetical protein A3A28_01100 [Candidatus Sungbacteria bacterium RIFCSPLOWO2_01_FULL_47_32]OHA12080.1 MAG: hypothetical protein A3H69_03565 [Candidatus Sungbacteria bacterium RIFCSPLOWO2_02_FULL_47_9]
MEDLAGDLRENGCLRTAHFIPTAFPLPIGRQDQQSSRPPIKFHEIRFAKFDRGKQKVLSKHMTNPPKGRGDGNAME